MPRAFPQTDPATLTADEIRDILRYGESLEEPKSKIVRFFEDYATFPQRADLLKSMYNQVYIGLLREDEQRFGYKRVDEADIHPQWERKPGLMLVKGNFMSPTAQVTLPVPYKVLCRCRLSRYFCLGGR
jgi:hypothetical protein